MVEYLAESDKGIGCAAQALVHIAAEGLAERVRRKPLDVELVFPEKPFQHHVDMLLRIWFSCAQVADDRQFRVGLAEQLVHLLYVVTYLVIDLDQTRFLRLLFDLYELILTEDVFPMRTADSGDTKGCTERDLAVYFPFVKTVVMQTMQ